MARGATLGATAIVVTRSHLRGLPTWLRVAVAGTAVVVGAALTTRPFTSLDVLVWLVAVAAVTTGLLRWVTARATAGRWDDVVAAGWVVLGVVVIAGLAGPVGVRAGLRWRRGSAWWPAVSAMSSVASGAASTNGRPPCCAGVVSVVLGVVALSWPDVTLLVVAVLFGARTVLFGLAELLSLVTGRTGDETPRLRGGVRRFGRLVASAVALVAALFLASVSATLREGEPALDEFYATPDDVPNEAGRLLRVEPFTRTMPADAEAWRILYTTTRSAVRSRWPAARDRTRQRSDAPSSVVAWAHGTTGVDPRWRTHGPR